MKGLDGVNCFSYWVAHSLVEAIANAHLFSMDRKSAVKIARARAAYSSYPKHMY